LRSPSHCVGLIPTSFKPARPGVPELRILSHPFEPFIAL
jgi:hypothetical protein